MKLPYAIYAPDFSFAESQKDLQLFVRITFAHHFISLFPLLSDRGYKIDWKWFRN